MNDSPSYTEGRAAIGEPVVRNLNTGTEYEYLSDNIDREAIEKEHADADGGPLGSHTSEGFEKGSINLQLLSADDSIARPGHTILLDVGEGSEYYTAGKFGRARTRREIVKGALAVRRAYNPILSSYLTATGGHVKTATQAAGVLATPINDAPTVVNARSGATTAFSIAAAPGYTLPAWLSINASTGVLSGTAVAGHWVIHVICTDTLAGKRTRKGFAVLDLTIT